MRAGRGRLLPVALLVGLTLAACTGSPVAPTAPTTAGVVVGTTASATAPAQTPVLGASPSSASSSAVSASAAVPAPEMTPIDTLRCASSHNLPAVSNPFPARVIWGAALDRATGTDEAVETVPGPDAARCAHVLPAGCDSPPWAWPPNERFFVASGATRRLRGESGTAGSTSATSAAPVVDRQSVQWGSLELPPGDPLGVLAHLRRTATECASAVPATVGGRPVLVGTAGSDYRQGPAVIVLLTGRDAAAWLTVDGTTVLPEHELARIVAAAAARLLPRG